MMPRMLPITAPISRFRLTARKPNLEQDNGEADEDTDRCRRPFFQAQRLQFVTCQASNQNE